MLKKVGPYDLLEKVGRGGMAAVYKAQHEHTGQIVAVKVLGTEVDNTTLLLKRFEQEFRTAARLSHPHIVKGLDFGLEKGRPYLVLEYVSGCNLGEQVQQLGCLPTEDAFSVTYQIASALEAAHRNHLVHRDVKPENILVTTEKMAKLTDLGLVKDLTSAAELTRSGASLGTMGFMAPEQYGDAKHVDCRCDVYSLAATLYFALTGQLPFVGRGQITILKKKMANEIRSLLDFLPSLPEALDETLCKALSADPKRRFSSCSEFVGSLRACMPEFELPEVYSDAESVSDAELKLPPLVPERRVAIRYPTALRASSWLPDDPEDPCFGELLDISTTGIRMELTKRFEPGAFLVLNLVDDRNVVCLSGRVRVCWVRTLTPGRWTIGCAFHRPLSEGELDTLVENKTDTVVEE
ncbi:MAG: protein kinase [Gemmataceae bacterium]